MVTCGLNVAGVSEREHRLLYPTTKDMTKTLATTPIIQAVKSNELSFSIDTAETTVLKGNERSKLKYGFFIAAKR